MSIELKNRSIPLRKDVPIADCWDTTPLYPNRESWQQDLEECKDKSNGIAIWPNLSSSHYNLEDSASLHSLLKTLLLLERKLDKLYTYAHLIHDQDITNSEGIADLKSVTHLFTKFGEEVSWIQPALIALPESIIKQHLTSPLLAPYRFYLEKIFRMAIHTGTAREEKILASAFPALEATNKTFSSLSDSEIPFGEAIDSKGTKHPLSHALASLYAHSSDRELRKSSYFAQCQRYYDYRHTFSNLLNGKIQAHLFNANARNYSSCLEAALFHNNIPCSVYTNLIATVKQNTSLITEYFNLKKTGLQLNEFHFYDVYAPLSESKTSSYSYKDAVQIICNALQPLGSEYVSILRNGLTEQRWVDKYENCNKRSGAYSSGCYDSYPYILLNYTGSLYDISVIAHEGGHSMHSYYSRKNQLFHNAQYPIFLAEIASTLNEMLLMDFLLKRSESKTEKITIITQCLDTIFATLFRQTLFADFEYQIHSAAEKGIPLTEEFLSECYSSLQNEFYGKVVTPDSLSGIEWARIPHFYYNFYVYQYATGIVAALCFAEKILNKEPDSLDLYLKFLKSGGSDFPLNILNDSGLNMATTDPMSKAFSFIKKKIHELSTLL
ncbi:oligoendopeptidase F [Chlamydia ibidis]|uniref:Oligopeptidase F n=2 Tax=Chlamydia ibidis TaxID=1405396 RepID=S7J2T1_9CHLA|nr:oligoendopeptidase F [Chlamydia ibidis]EPP34307.1 oligoendopeptidase F [Chlamydia ibidis]EQM62596.1 oligoendopeptidase F [Chlamydia ibidis 10-1398/6]